MAIDYNKVTVHIELDNLLHNYRLFTDLCGRVIPVVKSDAYGHGLVRVAQALEDEGVDTLAVGFVHEGAQLRRAGCRARILALLGPVDDGDLAALWSHRIVPFVARMDQLRAVADAAAERGPVDVALKFDTGMRRLGFRPEDLPEAVEFLKTNPAVNPVMVSSHLASADMPERADDVAGQAARFDGVVDGLRSAGFDVEANLANSAGALAHERCRMDSLRLGVAMYGGNPFHGTEWAELGARLRPAMSVSAPVLQIQELAKGEGVSYGWTYVAERDSVVAVVGAGYADAYSRSLSNAASMNVKGRRAPVRGRVCMQMTAVDVTDIMGEGVDVAPGDAAWLLGGPEPGTVAPEELAGWWKTITYEVFCLLGMNRRIYI